MKYKLTNHEKQSGLDRVTNAENLVLLLPSSHEGRNTWLMNYGSGPTARQLRDKHGLKWDEKTMCAYMPDPTLVNNKDKGLYDKFIISRVDGKSQPGEKHHNCSYFVLDMDCDPHAIPAVKAYADSCRETYPKLAADLDLAHHLITQRTARK